MNNKTTRVELVSQFHKKNFCAFLPALLVSLLSGTVGLLVSLILKEFIDLMSGQSRFSLTQLLFICLGLVGFILVLTAIDYFSQPVFIRRAMTQYKDKAFSLLSGKNIASFREETTSTYLSALTNDASTIEANYVSAILPICTKLVQFIGALILMLLFSPALTLCSIIILIIPTSISAIMGKKMAKVQQEVSDRNTEFVASLTDCLGGFQVIKSFKAEKEVYDLFEKEDRKLEDSKCRLRRIGNLAGALGGLAGLLTQLGVFVVGSYLATKGQSITPGAVMMFVNLLNFMITPLSELPKLWAGRKAASGLIDKLSDSLSLNNEASGSEEVESVGNGISFNNVSFSYDGEKDVLHDINCTFEPGKSYAIVGSSGSGKSTFLNLLMAANNNYNGDITIDGKELKDISPDSLYDLMTVIQQNVFIFNSSIRDNVTMFRDFSSDKVEDALGKAHLEELIKERGSSYLCGENGKGLSGGEKQRISIARSLLKDSSILLADEVTSALDAKTSHEVINEILDLESMTRIVVTHTLEEATLSRYDEILVIKDGTIAEKGNFGTLMRNDGYFKALYTVANGDVALAS